MLNQIFSQFYLALPSVPACPLFTNSVVYLTHLTSFVRLFFCQFIESDHPEISGVVEEPYHPVDGGEGDDVEQNHHIACNSFLYQQQKYVTEFIMGELNIGEYREMRKTYRFNEFQDKLREIVFSGCPILKTLPEAQRTQGIEFIT